MNVRRRREIARARASALLCLLYSRAGKGRTLLSWSAIAPSTDITSAWFNEATFVSAGRQSDAARPGPREIMRGVYEGVPDALDG